MKKSKPIFLLIVLLILNTGFMPVASAEETGKEEIDGCILEFSGFTKRIDDPHVKSRVTIPSTIGRSEIVTFDARGIRDSLLRGEKITVCINGTNYIMNLHEIIVNAPGENPGVCSFAGNLIGIEQSDVVLTVSNRVVLGRISIQDVDYISESLPIYCPESTEVLHYTYCSRDVAEEGIYITEPYVPPLPEDYSPAGKKACESADKIVGGSKTIADVAILVVTDNQWITDEPDWQTKAQSVIAEANNRLGDSDIQIRLLAIYDSSKRYVLSNDPDVLSMPLQTFYNHCPPSYLNGKGADIAIYMGGYDSTCPAIGAAYGYDQGGRHAWAQMADDPSPHDAVHHDRAIVSMHEIGHLFDADHQDASGQIETYNRAYEWTEWLIYTYQTAVWAPTMKSSRYEYSSEYGRGDSDHDNAQRMCETRFVVGNYI